MPFCRSSTRFSWFKTLQAGFVAAEELEVNLKEKALEARSGICWI
jgi:hypothetical protein